jgi:hypothetical protein
VTRDFPRLLKRKLKDRDEIFMAAGKKLVESINRRRDDRDGSRCPVSRIKTEVEDVLACLAAEEFDAIKIEPHCHFGSPSLVGISSMVNQSPSGEQPGGDRISREA